MAGAIAEFCLELGLGQRLLRRADRIGGLDRDRAPVGPPHGDRERSPRSALARDPGNPLRQRQHRGVSEFIHLGDAYLSVHQGGGRQGRAGRTAPRPPGSGAASPAHARTGRHDPQGRPRSSPPRYPLPARFGAVLAQPARHRSPRAMVGRKDRAWSSAPPLGRLRPNRGAAPRHRSRSAGTIEKSKAAIENVARPGKSGLCQNR